MKIDIVRLTSDLPMPEYKTPGASGFDLCANVPKSVLIVPRERMFIPTGIKVSVPEGYEIQIRPRSGLAYDHGITVINTPGTIDSDYRGELCVLLLNLGDESIWVKRGDRIAQGVVCPIIRAEWNVVQSLDVTDRGEGGLGSTGR